MQLYLRLQRSSSVVGSGRKSGKGRAADVFLIAVLKREGEKERQIDRQTDLETDRQVGREADKQLRNWSFKNQQIIL